MADIGKPVLSRDIDRAFERREAKSDTPIAIQRQFQVAAQEEPKVNARVVAREGADGTPVWDVKIDIEGVVPERASLPALEGKPMRMDRREIPEEKLAEQLVGFMPEHLGFNAQPLDWVKSTRRILDLDIGRRGWDPRLATTIFGGDDRRAFRDTTYPWSTIGLVETNRGSGSGVMIGPRHMLTVSHVIDWTAPPGFAADWVRFTPSYYDGGAPFGEAYGTNIYWFVQEDGDGFISGIEGDFDYAVVVLNSRIGETTGWMGARGYDDDWDSLAAWSHMGYPGDLNSGQRPTWQGWFTIDGTDAPAQSILHQADVFPGQSGGPIFGFWDGDVGPRAVAVQSWETSTTNGASGSRDMRDLVAQARTDFA